MCVENITPSYYIILNEVNATDENGKIEELCNVSKDAVNPYTMEYLPVLSNKKGLMTFPVGIKKQDYELWNPDIKNVDLVLIGDYVDWRGEPLEGDPGSWVLGSKRIINLIISLYNQVRRLNEEMDDFTSKLSVPGLFPHWLAVVSGLFCDAAHRYGAVLGNVE